MKATIEIPDGYTLVKVNGTEYKVVKNEKNIPDTWEEFCEMNPIKADECYISDESEIVCCQTILTRNSTLDCNWLPSKEKAEAILALCQLIQLRDCYNDGWVPDWSNNEAIDCLYLYNGKWNFSLNSVYSEIFSFKSPELCRKFHENFRDLLDKIKPIFNESKNQRNRRAN